MEFLRLDREIREKYPGLEATLVRLEGVRVEGFSQGLEDYKSRVIEEVAQRYTLDTLKDNPLVRAYRDFFWKLGVDPTKNRPASEALIRRALRRRRLPQINTCVDAYNLASMETLIPVACFDYDKLHGELVMRSARQGEEFLGIGMRAPVELKGGEAVVEDQESLVAVYPYRDADYSKVTLDSENVLVMVCGVPGVPREKLVEATHRTVGLIQRFCGGKVE